jgi:hypothetical protein
LWMGNVFRSPQGRRRFPANVEGEVIRPLIGGKEVQAIEECSGRIFIGFRASAPPPIHLLLWT